MNEYEVTDEWLRVEIINFINIKPGLTRIDISLKLMELIIPTRLDTQQFVCALDFLTSNGHVTYFTFEHRDFVETFYFPQNTRMWQK